MEEALTPNPFKSSKVQYRGVAIICLFISIHSGYELSTDNFIPGDGIVRLNYVIQREPAYNTKYRHAHESFTVMGISREFRIGGHELKCCDRIAMERTVDFADTVIIGLATEDVSEVNQETFSANYNDVKSFSHNGVEYIDLACVAYRDKKNRMDGLIIGVAGFIFTFAASFFKERFTVWRYSFPTYVIVVALIGVVFLLMRKV